MASFWEKGCAGLNKDITKLLGYIVIEEQIALVEGLT